MKVISLFGGNGHHFAKVDDEDYERVVNFGRWGVYIDRNVYYARTTDGQHVSMHFVVLGKTNIDHVNLDGLDNQKHNLRVASHSQQMANTGVSKRNTSGYKGVFSIPESKKWRAQMVVNRKQLYLGRFDTKEQAAIAYNTAALQYFGSFARLNDLAMNNNDGGSQNARVATV